MSLTRRSFAKCAALAAAGNLAGLRPFGILNGLAETNHEYKALVCIFLFGGNDSNNVLIPFDASGYGTYASVRGPLALAQNSLLPLTRQPAFALHPSLPEVQTLFDTGNAAFLANVGTLVQPLTQAQYQAGQLPIPDYLFSHQDQQLEWQNSEISSATPSGWAGRVSDLLSARYNAGARIPLVTSVAGDTLFCNGVTTSPVAVVPESVSTGQCSEGKACNVRQLAEQKIINFASGFHLVQEDTITTRLADTYISRIADALLSVEPLQTRFPPNALGLQLEQIAQLIKIRSAMGVTRQIFFAGVGNFDTHSNQLPLQQKLLSVISPAMGAFYQATQELEIQNQVTSFTMSDFARAFQPNSNNGTDHGWGGHQIVFGGAVKGGKIYGDFPTQALGGPNDLGINGRWIPTTSSAQFAATLASWFGVPQADLPVVFPLLGNFSDRNLGFLG